MLRAVMTSGFFLWRKKVLKAMRAHIKDANKDALLKLAK